MSSGTFAAFAREVTRKHQLDTLLPVVEKELCTTTSSPAASPRLTVPSSANCSRNHRIEDHLER